MNKENEPKSEIGITHLTITVAARAGDIAELAL